MQNEKVICSEDDSHVESHQGLINSNCCINLSEAYTLKCTAKTNEHGFDDAYIGFAEPSIDVGEHGFIKLQNKTYCEEFRGDEINKITKGKN